MGRRAPSLSECAVTTVASMSTMTCPPSRVPGVPASGRRRDQTRSRAAARAARTAVTAPSAVMASALDVANNRDTVGSEATVPNRCAGHAPRPRRPGSHHRGRPRSRRQAAPCPDRDEPGPPATAPVRWTGPGRRPAIRIASIIINEPDDVTNDSRTSSRTNTADRATLHLRSAFPLEDLETSAIPMIPCRTGTSVHHTPSQTPTVMKLRGLGRVLTMPWSRGR